jgi:hypothetical protein
MGMLEMGHIGTSTKVHTAVCVFFCGPISMVIWC